MSNKKEKEKVYLLMETQVFDTEDNEVSVLGVFRTPEAAKAELKKRVNKDDIKELKREWKYEGCEEDWDDTDDSFEIYPEGEYNEYHVSFWITESELFD